MIIYIHRVRNHNKKHNKNTPGWFYRLVLFKKKREKYNYLNPWPGTFFS